MYGQERQVKVSVANKRIKKVKGQRNWSLIGNGILLITILILLIIGLQMVVTYNEYYSSEEDSSDDDIYSYIYNDIIYDDGIFVHKDGDNSTGDNWEEAYTTLNGAIFETSSDLDDKTIIFVGLGLFDVNIANYLLINKNVHIVGSGREATIFSNSHTNAQFVFNITQNFVIEKSEIFFNQSSGGINVYNTSSSKMFDINFNTEINHTGNPEALRINGAFHGKYSNIHFDGFDTASTAINISGADHNEFDNIAIYKFNSSAIQICNNSDSNKFEVVHIMGSAIGLNIDSGVGQVFHEIDFFNCTVNVDDEIGNSYWHDVETDRMIGAVTPADLTGIDVDGDLVANTYGDDVLVYDGSVIDTPYYIIAVIYEPDAGERYGLRIWDTFSLTYIYETVLEAKFPGQLDRQTIEMPRIFNAHTQIYISIKSETGGDDMDIWLEIVTI